MKNLKEMEPSSPSKKESLVCQTCGDEGFKNAYVYCVKCLEFVIHRYCLKVIPKTFTEAVIWYCESCKPQPPPPQVKSSPSQNNESKQNINPTWSETSTSDSDSDSSWSSNMKAFDEWESRIAQQNQRVDRIIDDMIISYPNLILQLEGEGDNLSRPQKTKKKKEKKVKEEDVSEVILPNFENNNVLPYAQPIIDPLWRGSFSVNTNGGDEDILIYEGFVGHLSNKACIEVCEEANRLPSLLQLQMHQKSLLWPKSFKDTEPSDDHVAIYFFPGDSINERAFDELVQDMMDGDLAMRATVEEKSVDLLIFTSAALPPLFRRFQGKHYLWGVFKGKRNNG